MYTLYVPSNLVPGMHLTPYVSVWVCTFLCVCIWRERLIAIWMYTYNSTYIFSAWTKSFEKLNVITRLLHKLRKHFTLTLKKMVYVFLAALGLCCSTGSFSSCRERDYSLVAVHRLLFAMTSPTVEHRLLGQASVVAACRPNGCGTWALEHRLSNCSAWAQLLHSTWDLPGPEIKPMSPTLAGRFLSTGPSGKLLILAFRVLLYKYLFNVIIFKKPHNFCR